MKFVTKRRFWLCICFYIHIFSLISCVFSFCKRDGFTKSTCILFPNLVEENDLEPRWVEAPHSHIHGVTCNGVLLSVMGLQSMGLLAVLFSKRFCILKLAKRISWFDFLKVKRNGSATANHKMVELFQTTNRRFFFCFFVNYTQEQTRII